MFVCILEVMSVMSGFPTMSWAGSVSMYQSSFWITESSLQLVKAKITVEIIKHNTLNRKFF